MIIRTTKHNIKKIFSKIKQEDSYFFYAIVCIVLLLFFSVVYFIVLGIDKSSFILGLLSGALGSAIAFLFNMSSATQQSKRDNYIKVKNDLKNIYFELKMNHLFILEAKEQVQITDFYKLDKLNYQEVLKVDALKTLDYTLLCEKDLVLIKDYLKMINIICNGKKLIKKKELKEYIDASQNLLNCIDNILKRDDFK